VIRPPPAQGQAPLPTRRLGGTGREVTLFGLGGEGVLRTFGREREAVEVIHRALDQGVTYCDTSPAYAGSLDYYGAALGERRARIFLASKTHDRTRDGSMRLLDDMLRRLRTDRLDLWQLHDLRGMDELDMIFGRGGALEAAVAAREEGRVGHVGITGHHDPAVLMEAMRRFDFDTVLLALNPADPHRRPFIGTVLAEACRRGMGVIAMKTCAQGALLRSRGLSMKDCLHYAWSLPGVSLAIVGCSTPDEVDENAALARAFRPLEETELRALETRTRPFAEAGSYFKKR
jgi:predicted aldo/keto reductase-like oxidoreductase